MEGGCRFYIVIIFITHFIVIIFITHYMQDELVAANSHDHNVNHAIAQIKIAIQRLNGEIIKESLNLSYSPIVILDTSSVQINKYKERRKLLEEALELINNMTEYDQPMVDAMKRFYQG